MNKNERFELRITDLGNTGEGIGKTADGFTFFVKDTVPGDLVEASVMKCKKNYGYAKLQKILEPSPHRVDAPCENAKACGGCILQAMDYEEQLRYKEDKVRSCLERIGGFSDIPVEPVHGMKIPFRYRNKSVFPVRRNKKTGQVEVGFYAAGTHDLIPVMDCLVGIVANRIVLKELLEWMEKEGTTPYDEETGTGCIRHIMIRKGFATGEVHICFIVNEPITGGEALIERVERYPQVVGVSINVNRENTNAIFGDKTIPFWGRAYLTDHIGDVTFRISPESFYQVNPVQTKVLYKTARKFAALTGTETVWDLYCGIGTISLFLAKNAAKVYGIEIVPGAVEDAKKNAELNEIRNAEFYCGKAEELFPEMMSERQERADVVVLDPPRKGCETELLEAILSVAPSRIVYVSCDPATLARDLKILCAETYRPEKVQPVDMFPQTGHVETVVLLSREK